MTQDNPFFGLNMLPVFLEMIEAKLEIAENQLSSLVDVKNLAENQKQVILNTDFHRPFKSTKLPLTKFDHL